MQVAFVIYTGMTALDFIGVYDPITRLKAMGFIPDLQWEICAYSQIVSDQNGLHFTPTRVGESLQGYDIVIVPGGVTATILKLIDDIKLVDWLRSAEDCQLKVSVCTGSLLLGAAGFLAGRAATTHPNAFNELQRFCASVVDQRIVDEGDLITARGVTASIDLGLYLCEKLAGHQAQEKIRQRMDYPYGT